MNLGNEQLYVFYSFKLFCFIVKWYVCKRLFYWYGILQVENDKFEHVEFLFSYYKSTVRLEINDVIFINKLIHM